MEPSTRVLAFGALSAAILAIVTAYAATYVPPVSPPESSVGSFATTSTPGAVPALAASGKAGRVVLPRDPDEQSRFNRFIVRYKVGSAPARTSATVLSAMSAAAARAGIAGVATQDNGATAALAMQYMRRLAIGADVVRLSRGLSQSEADAFLAQLRSDPTVEYAQPDYVKQALGFTPNDPYYNVQWHYTNAASGIQLPSAWNIATGTGVVVAVIDTGYLDHADLGANIIQGYDFIVDTEVSGDGDGRDTDAHDPGDWYSNFASTFHGTHVAGTVAAITNNGLGTAGVAFNARVEPVRVLGHGGGYTSDIADAIVWASGGSVAGVPANSNPAEVINMSLGGHNACSNDPVTQSAIDSANSRGTIVVVAAGNSNDDASNYTPAGCKGVITVGANGSDGARSYFSNYGAAVTVSAPGGNATSGSDPSDRWIWSLGNTGIQSPDPSPSGDAVVGMIGTSMASPHVAGVVALMQSAAVAAGRPPLTLAQVRSVLRSTVTPWTLIPPANKSEGPGIVNATAAVQAATQPIPPDTGTLIVNRVPLGGQSGGSGETVLYKLAVPAGRSSVSLRTYGGSGDVSLYMARDRFPTATSYDMKSVKPGNSEAIFVTSPGAGTYYLLVVGETAFGGLSVLGTY